MFDLWNESDFEFGPTTFLNEVKVLFPLGLIIGVYWTLRPLKDSIFIQMVDKFQLPFAKTVSVIILLPLVMFYTKLIEKTSREKMLIILPAFYGLSILIFSLIMLKVQGNSGVFPRHFEMGLGYFGTFFVESFGSLVVALFWAFSADTTEPTSAKRGFPLVVALGQLGGIILPYSIRGLPRLHCATDFLSMVSLSLMILMIISLVRYLLRVTPKSTHVFIYESKRKGIKRRTRIS